MGSSAYGESMADAGYAFHFVEIGGDNFAGIDGALFVNRIQHSGNLEVNAVETFSGHDGRIVHAMNGVTDDFVVFGILELDGLEIGDRQCGSLFGERALDANP